MIVQQAKALARQWVREEAGNIPGFAGAFFHGSINWMAGDALLPAGSDLDLMLVLDAAEPPVKLGKLIYHDLLLEISYMARSELASAEAILGQSHMAGSFQGASVIADPTGQLAAIESVVSRHYADREWVLKRCEHAMDKIRNNLRGVDESAPFHDQVAAWLFATGVTTHVLLVAGLKNPTVRRRYVAVRELLSEYGRLDFYETLLELLGCATLSKARVAHHLEALAEVFDVTKNLITTPFFFASDISDDARPIAIGGSRALIEQGLQREAIFWIVATASRCQKVLYHDAPPVLQEQYRPGYQELLADLGIHTAADLQARSRELKAFLPQLWSMAETIIEQRTKNREQKILDLD